MWNIVKKIGNKHKSCTTARRMVILMLIVTAIRVIKVTAGCGRKRCSVVSFMSTRLSGEPLYTSRGCRAHWCQWCARAVSETQNRKRVVLWPPWKQGERRANPSRSGPTLQAKSWIQSSCTFNAVSLQGFRVYTSCVVLESEISQRLNPKISIHNPSMPNPKPNH